MKWIGTSNIGVLLRLAGTAGAQQPAADDIPKLEQVAMLSPFGGQAGGSGKVDGVIQIHIRGFVRQIFELRID
jgi:hypothetical protein